MFGIFLTALSATFREIGTSIGKNEFHHHRESVYTMGVISGVISVIFFTAINIFTGDFLIDPASYPTVFLRLILEITLTFVTLQAVATSTRSVFTFLRILTLPLLVFVDLFIGYALSLQDIGGIGIIIFGLVFLHLKDSFSKKGRGWVIASAVLAVVTTSLYKYNITFYNTVAAEQTLMLTGNLIALVWASFFIGKENPFSILFTPKHLFQSTTSGAGRLLSSYALLFAPASVIMSAKRAFSILASIISGHYYFRERHLFEKLGAFLAVSTGIILLVL